MLKRLVPRCVLVSMLWFGALPYGTLSCVLLSSCIGQEVPIPLPTTDAPPTLADSAAALRSPHALLIECVASEPQIVDPISIQFDAEGDLWVVEMPDYPTPSDPTAPPAGRIKRLQDSDGDGFFETMTVFADQLSFPTGIASFQEGWLVTLGGELRWMCDRDGDGVADEGKTLLKGFAQENTQLRANHPTWSHDGWLHISNGLRGGSIQLSNDTGEPLSLQGSDLRFDPWTLKYEATTGIGQFGLTFDGAGRRFVCSNRNPGLQIVFERRDVELNPLAAIVNLTHNAAIDGERSRIYPISHFWTTSNLHAGQFTAACGVLRYRGNALGVGSDSWLLTCDPTGNLVHAESLTREGAIFHGEPIAEETEWLASLDPWFRPVDLQIGPDGALYIVDMCRAVIEHPDFMPTELKTRADLRWGRGAGRIWRISSNQVTRDLSLAARDASLQQLAPLAELTAHSAPDDWKPIRSAIYSENPWVQDQACRLLHQWLRSSAPDSALRASSVAALSELLRQTTLDHEASDSTRIGALRLLARAHLPIDRESFCDTILLPTLNSSCAALQCDALKLARDERLVPQLSQETWLALVTSDDGEVRMQTAITLSQCELPERSRWLAQLMLLSQSEFEANAVLIGTVSAEEAAQLLTQLDLNHFADERLTADPSSASTLIANDSAALVAILSLAASTRSGETQLALLAQIRQLDRNQHSLLSIRLIDSLLTRTQWIASLANARVPDGWDDETSSWWEQMRGKLFQTMMQSSAATELRVAACELLLKGTASHGAAAESLNEAIQTVLLTPEASALKVAIARGLNRLDSEQAWQAVWSSYSSQPPGARAAILSAALATAVGRATLVDALEADQIRAADLTPQVKQRLAQVELELVERFNRWQATWEQSRQTIDLTPYRQALAVDRDPLVGQALFMKHCSNCHRIGSLGVDVGPDISDSRVKESLQLLEDILNPNGSIDANFVAYTGETIDGLSFQGVLVSETSNSVTVRINEGKLLTIARTDLVSFQSTGRSLMPEGLDQSLNPDEMAALIAYVKRWRYLDNGVPGVEPKRESPDTETR